MRIVVVGAGAMGSIYGARLSQHNDVTLIDTNDELVKRINSSGIVLEEGGETHLFHPKAAKNVDGLCPVDLVILFTKALYSVSALENVKSVIGENTYLMTLQNGAGHEKILSRFTDVDHIVIGTTEDNGAVIDMGIVHHGGRGITNIGLLKDGSSSFLEEIKDSFNASGFDVRIHRNIQQLIWDKLMTNVSLSALTAVLQCDMSYISENDYATAICKELIREAVDVALAMGLSFNLEKVTEKVLSTSRNNKGGYTSIMMDIKNGRRSEVDTITGALVSKAHELGIPVSYHEMVLSLIHALEGKRR